MMTPRQAQIAALVSTGASNKEIAARLNIAEGTVKAHLYAIYRDLSISGRVELVLYLRAPDRL